MTGHNGLGRAALVVCLGISGACVTAGTGPGAGNRKDFGHVEVYSDPPVTNTVVIDHFDFRVEQLRVSEGAPGNANNFAYSLEQDGCLHGQRMQNFCRVPAAKADRPELSRWRAVASPTTFATTLSPDGKTLVVEAGNERGVFALGQGEAIDELRQQPWMLGLAFATGHAPRARSRDDGASLDFRFVVEAAAK
jgi:hypothetical protein